MQVCFLSLKVVCRKSFPRSENNHKKDINLLEKKKQVGFFRDKYYKTYPTLHYHIIFYFREVMFIQFWFFFSKMRYIFSTAFSFKLIASNECSYLKFHF